MSNPSIRSAAIEALIQSTQKSLPPIEILDDTPLAAGGLGISSVAFLHAFVFLEERYGVTFDDASVFRAKFGTVGDFVAFMETALKNQPAKA